jgi:hypothetical protein
MGAIFGWLLQFASSGVVGKVTDYLTKRSNDAAVMHGQDTTAATQIVVAQMQAAVEANKTKAEFSSGHGTLVGWITAAIILHVWMWVLDKCFHLSWMIPGLDDWEQTIILSFFIITPTAAIARGVAAKVWK